MALSVTIITTANRRLRFIQTDPALVSAVLNSLRGSGHLFLNRSSVISSDSEVQIFSPSAITRIEIDGGADLSSYFPAVGETPLSMLPEETRISPQISEDFISVQMDFFFEGGDSVSLLLATERSTSLADRTMRITRIFEQQLITYLLPNGGIGLMNPSRMTRAKIHGQPESIPLGSWQLHPA